MGDLAGDTRRLEKIVQLEAHAGDVVAEPIKRGGIVEIDQHQAAIELVHADLEYAGQREAPEARQHAGRRDAELRDHQVDLVADRHAELLRQLRTEHDVVRAGLQIGELAELHVLADLGDFFFLFRQYAADQRAGDFRADLHQRLTLDVRRSGRDLRILLGVRGHAAPVRQTFGERRDRCMRSHAENAGAQFLLEAIHDREHDDQCRHAETNAEHRGQRDERDEMVAPLGACVTQAQQQLVEVEARFDAADEPADQVGQNPERPRKQAQQPQRQPQERTNESHGAN